MPDVIVNKNGVFIDTHVRYRTISDNLSKQEYKFLLTTTLTISGWDELNQVEEVGEKRRMKTIDEIKEIIKNK